jgi:hypothetical protein
MENTVLKCGRADFYIDVNPGDIDTAGPHNRGPTLFS